MSTTTLHLDKGEIMLADDRIIIQDKARREKNISLLLGGFWLLYGVTTMWSLQTSVVFSEQIQLWIGAIIASLSAVGIIRTLRQSTIREVPLNTIKHFRLRSNMMGEKSLVLTLRNGYRRTIVISAPVTNDLLTYFYKKGLQKSSQLIIASTKMFEGIQTWD